MLLLGAVYVGFVVVLLNAGGGATANPPIEKRIERLGELERQLQAGA